MRKRFEKVVFPAPKPTKKSIPLLIVSLLLTIALFVLGLVLLPDRETPWHVVLARAIVGFPICWGTVFGVLWAVVWYYVLLFKKSPLGTIGERLD